MEYKKTRSC